MQVVTERFPASNDVAAERFPHTRERRTTWRHFKCGDQVKVGGLRGRYEFLGSFIETDGLEYVTVRKAGYAADRIIDPRTHEIVDADAEFTWNQRDRDEVYYPDSLGGGVMPEPPPVAVCDECGRAPYVPGECGCGR